MIPSLSDILRCIKDGSLLSPDVLRTLDHDAILDVRDGDAEFETEWLQCYKDIEAMWPTASVTVEMEALCQEIRRKSFLTVSWATAQHEIASYVSDDFDIIMRGSILGLDNDFLNRLWSAYDQNEIPTPVGR